jgi:hypothetical protein
LARAPPPDWLVDRGIRTEHGRMEQWRPSSAYQMCASSQDITQMSRCDCTGDGPATRHRRIPKLATMGQELAEAPSSRTLPRQQIHPPNRHVPLPPWHLILLPPESTACRTASYPHRLAEASVVACDELVFKVQEGGQHAPSEARMAAMLWSRNSLRPGEVEF